jgi:hypothetical protein
VRDIANKDLTLADIPSVDAGWDELGEFALTFDGYRVWGSFEKCAEIANSRRQESLTDLRTCLFFVTSQQSGPSAIPRIRTHPRQMLFLILSHNPPV